jgi:hypothetical protein
MSPGEAGTSGEEIWQPKGNPWIIAVAVSLAAFMEVLDTSIANVALPHIAGNLGASNDESTWVLTGYLVSNAIVFSGDHFGNASAKHGRSERHRYDRGHRDQGAGARHQLPVDCAGQRQEFAATADPISDRRSQCASETVNFATFGPFRTQSLLRARNLAPYHSPGSASLAAR